MDISKFDLRKYFDRYFKGNEKIAFLLITIVIFLVCYGLVFNAYIINHDSVNRIYDGIESATSGRFMRKPLNDLLSFGTYNPINASLLLYVFLTMIALTFIKMFKVSSIFSQTIVVATVYSYPLFGFFWFYGNDIWQYALAFLCMIVAVKHVTQRGIHHKLIAMVMIIIGLATYQAFLSVLTAVFALWYIATGLRTDQFDWRDFIQNFLILIVSAIIYFVLVKVVLFVTGAEMVSYRGADQVSIKTIIVNLPHSILLAYKDTIKFILAMSKLFNTYFNHAFLNIAILSAYPLALFKAYQQKRSKHTLISVAILMIFLPVMINSGIFLISKVTDYAQFGYLPLMLGAIIFWLQFGYNHARIIITYLILIYIYVNIGLLNTMLFVETEQSNQTLAIGQQLVFDLLGSPNYDPSDPVEICGKFAENENYLPAPSTKYDISSKWLKPGADTFLLKSKEVRHLKNLFKNLGYDVKVVAGQADCTTTDHPQFPESGYITPVIIDGQTIYQIYLS